MNSSHAMTEPAARSTDSWRDPNSAPAATSHARTKRGFPLGRVAGIELRADFSLLIVFGLIAFNLGAAVFPSWHPGWGPALN